MTLLNTSGVLVILTVILLLWFVPRSLRRAPAGPSMEPERPLISAERTAEDILASAGVLLNESEAYQSSDHAVAPGTSLPSSALPQASSRSSHAVEDAVQSAPDTASISQIRESSPTAPYTDEIPVVEEAKSSPLSYFDTSSPSGIALLVAAGLGVLVLVTGLLALFDVLAWGWAVLFLILAGGAWAVSRFGLLESVANQVKASRDARQAKAEGDEDDEAEDEAYEESDEHEEAGDDASEPVEDSAAEGVEPEVAEEPAHHARPATREATTRKSIHGVNREAARSSRAHIAVESSDEAPEAAPRAEAPAAAPAHSSRAVPARSARAAEAPVAHRQERRQQRPSRFQPIRRGSVLFDQESGSATSSGAPRTAAQPQQVAQAPVAPVTPSQPVQSQPVQPQRTQSVPSAQPVQSQPVQPQPVQSQRAQRVPSAQPAQPAQPVAPQSTQAPAAQQQTPAQQSAIQPAQPVARQALRDGSPVRQAPAAPAAQAPAQPIPEEIPLPDVLDDSEFDALDIASLNNPALSTGAVVTGGVRSTNRHPGAGSSFEAVSNTWNPVQLPKPLSALHRQDKNQGKK